MNTTKRLENEINRLKKLFLDLKSENRFSRLGTLFQTQNKNYFFDSGTGKIFEINNNVYNVLDCLLLTNKFDKLLELDMTKETLINSLVEIEQAVENEHILKMPQVETMLLNNLDGKTFEEAQIQHISFEMTERCNLRCKYCVYHEGQGSFREFGGGDISFNVIKKTIDLLSKSTSKDVYISFYGGEPLLKFDLIKQCISYCEETLADKEIYYNMTTNCTLVTDEIAEYLSSLKNYFTTVSLDGPQFIHDANRIDINGDGSFDKTLEGLKKLVIAEGENASQRINFNIVLEKINNETFDIVQNFFDTCEYIPPNSTITTSYITSGNKEFKYFGVDTEEERMLEKNINPLTEWTMKSLFDGIHNSNKLISMDTVNKELSNIHKRLVSNEPIKHHRMNGCCVPSARRLYVTVDGNFAVCERIGPSPFIGNVEIGIDKNKIKKHYIDDFTKEASKYCNECWAVNLCGLCYINCYDEEGIHLSYRHRNCYANRRVLKNSLIRYHEILEVNPESLNYLNDIEYA